MAITISGTTPNFSAATITALTSTTGTVTTLTNTTLSDGTNSTSTTNPIRGSAKAWVNFSGVTTVTINSSYNVSSVTRTATGQYTINMTTAMSDVNYAFVVNGANDSNGCSYAAPRGIGQTITTSSFMVTGCNGGNAITDMSYCYIAVFR